MSVFQNYSTKRGGGKGGGVNANAFPNSHTYPAVTTQQNVRANPNIPSQPQRISPTEKGATFPTSASGGGSLSPSYPVTAPTLAPNSGGPGIGGGCGCGAGCGGGIGRGANPTASQLATGHSFHGFKGKSAPGGQSVGQVPRFGSVGGIRPTANRTISRGRPSGRTNQTPYGPMFGTRLKS
jgi:hypothetical protein